MWNPQATTPGSIMPGYKWMFENKKMKHDDIQKKMSVMKTLGVPYTDTEIANAFISIDKQAIEIEKGLETDPNFSKSYAASKEKAKLTGEKFVQMKDREIVALIAYLQRLGTDIKVKK
jgi:cytochrome c oxidase cbb3-type subunit I/II